MKKKVFHNQKKIITGIIILLVITIIGGGLYYNFINTKETKAANIEYNSLQSDGNFYNKLKNSTPEDGYLTEEITNQQIEEFINQLEDKKSILKKYNQKHPKNKFDLTIINKLYDKLGDLEYKLSIEEKLKKLITYSGYLSDTNPQVEKVAITDSLTNKSLDEFIKVVQSRKVAQDKWGEKIQSLISELTKQLEQIEVATTETNTLFEGEKVKEGISLKDYESALVEVEKITREKERKELLEKLNQVKAYLDEQNDILESSKLDRETTETTTEETAEEKYLLNSLDEARSYLAEIMPQSGGPQSFVNGVVTSEGYYSFDYQLVGGPDGVTWNRVIVDRNKNIISDDYLATVTNEDMGEVFDYYEDNSENTLTEQEAIQVASQYHNNLGYPGASISGISRESGGFSITYISTDATGKQTLYSYFVNDDGSVIDQGIAEIISPEEYEDEFE